MNGTTADTTPSVAASTADRLYLRALSRSLRRLAVRIRGKHLNQMTREERIWLLRCERRAWPGCPESESLSPSAAALFDELRAERGLPADEPCAFRNWRTI